jgi:hypothetical protein
MAEGMVGAVFLAAMETMHTGYWKTSSHVAINGYHGCRFHRVWPGATSVRIPRPRRADEEALSSQNTASGTLILPKNFNEWLLVGSPLTPDAIERH